MEGSVLPRILKRRFPYKKSAEGTIPPKRFPLDSPGPIAYDRLC